MRSFGRLLLLTGLILSFPVFGVEPKTGDGGAAIKKAQGLIRQLSQEKTLLEDEKAALLTEKSTQGTTIKTLEEAVKKLLPLQVEIDRYKTGLESMKIAFENQQSQLGDERRNRQALVEKHNEMLGKAKAIYADNQLLMQAVREREQWIEQCSARNQQVRTANLDILNKFREKGWWQQLGELEPFTGIARVEADSTVEEYKYQLKQLQMTPFKATDTNSEAKPPSAATDPANSPVANDPTPVDENALSSDQHAETGADAANSVKDAGTKPALNP